VTPGDLHPDAPPAKAQKYARRERERRFLLAALPKEGHLRRVLIEDNYLSGTRLRLRRITELGAEDEPGGLTYKLTQKIPAPDGTPGLITTLYLSVAEYEALAGLPTRSLQKVRTSIPPFGVDEFRGALAGLILAEAEFESEELAAAFHPSIEVVAEVTADIRFTGGRLVQAEASDVPPLLAEFGIRRDAPSR
jgi:CYTH domain-containing protein